MQKTFKSLMVAFLAVALLGTSAMAERPAGESKERSTNSLSKTNGSPRYQILNINNLWTWYRSDGQSSHSPNADDGTYFPRGTGSSDYQNGVMWGAKCYADAALTQPAPSDQTIRVGGANYAVGTREGRIVGTGATAVAANPADADVRIYRVRRDYAAMSENELKRDAQETNELTNINDVTTAQMDAVKAQYATDWSSWPAQYGAPYIDRNGNGQYDAPPAFSATFTVDSLISQNRDEPGVAGADPNSPADQVIWTVFNDLDANATIALQGSEPMGLETQVTIWGYKRSDALGNIYFKRVKLINKGGVAVDAAGNKGAFYMDSVYVGQWADIDLGNAGDDISGCDVALGMGFTYNGQAVDTEYRGFKLPPPAVGFDFLAGPIVPAPGEKAVFDLKQISDFKNLPMTSFSYFSAGAPISDPPRAYTTGTLRWYKMLAGFAPKDNVTEFYPFPPGITPDKFPLAGDPVAKTGFLDGLGTQYSFAPGDRRINLATGPFTLSPGETQEFTVAYVAGLGADRLSSVAVMKFNDRFAQNTYNALFQVPKPPAPPIVEVGELDGQIILQWGGNAGRVADTETKVNQPGGYAFEGYNLYQFPKRGASKSEAIRIATYDLIADPTVILDEQFDLSSGQILFKPVAFGTNSGITRIFSTTRDYVKDIDKLYNGQEYYFAVTAYSRATQPGFLPAYLESDPSLITVVPKVPFGAQLTAAQGDVAAVATHVGASDGNVIPIVSDPSKLTGHDYEVTFKDDGKGGTLWTLKNVTANRIALADQTNQSGDANYLFADGFQLKVLGAPNSFKNFLVTANASGPLDPPEIGCFAFNDNGFPFYNGSDRPADRQQVGDGEWGIHTADNGSRSAFSAFLGRVSNADANWPRIIPQDWEIRFTEAGGYAHDPFVTAKTIKVPFELWRIGDARQKDPSDDVRFIPHLLDDDASGTFNLCATHPNAGGAIANEHSLSGGDNDPYTDWIYFATPTDVTPGDAGYKAWEAAELAQEGSGEALIANETLRRVVIVSWNGGSVSDPTFPANLNQQLPETGTIFQIITTKPNTPADKFTFKTAAPLVTADLQKASASDIGVYPNPYYAFNPAETSSLNRFITFNNLPPNAKIRIFNLAGQLVRTIDKTEAGNSSQFQRWDLLNTSGLPIATGMYIAYIEATLPATGQAVSKIVKFAVIQEQEVLEVF